MARFALVLASIRLCTRCLYLIITCIPDAGKALIYYQTTTFRLLNDNVDNKISTAKGQKLTDRIENNMG